MGTFKERMGISNGHGGAIRWVEALVDTGATYSVLPDAMLREEVGIRDKGHKAFTYGDGSEVLLPIGEARLHIGDQDASSTVVFGEDDKCVLGATTLQLFGLIPDTSRHRLIPAPELLI